MYTAWNDLISFLEGCRTVDRTQGYIDINYLIWKMVLLMFAIPITLIYANGFEKSTYVFEVTGPIKWVIGILMIIWLVGTIIFTIRFLKKYRAIRKDILNADPCGDEIQVW